MNPVLSLSLLIPILVVVVALGLWLSWKSSLTAPSRLRKILLGLRLLVMLALAVFLLNPGKWQSMTDEVTRIWAVMLDSSRSMSVTEGESTRAEMAAELRQVIAESAENAGVEVRYFTFGDQLNEADQDGAITPDGSQSDLLTSADTLLTQLSAQGEPLA